MSCWIAFCSEVLRLFINLIYRSNENRLAYTCASIYQINLKELIQSFRKPRTKKNDPQGSRLREEIIADRGDVKRLLKEIVSSLAQMCQNISDDTTFKNFVSAGKNQMIEWCKGTAKVIEEIPVDDDLTDEEYEIVKILSFF